MVNAFDMAITHTPIAQADQTLEAVMDLFQNDDVDSLPVVDDADQRIFLGIIEQRNVLGVLHVGTDHSGNRGR